MKSFVWSACALLVSVSAFAGPGGGTVGGAVLVQTAHTTDSQISQMKLVNVPVGTKIDLGSLVLPAESDNMLLEGNSYRGGNYVGRGSCHDFVGFKVFYTSSHQSRTFNEPLSVINHTKSIPTWSGALDEANILVLAAPGDDSSPEKAVYLMPLGCDSDTASDLNDTLKNAYGGKIIFAVPTSY